MAWLRVNPDHFRYLSLGIALFYLLPLSLGIFTGIYLWMSPFILLNSTFALKSFSILNFLGIVILIAAFVRDRWFCRYLCPTGVLCDGMARLQGNKVRLKSVPRLNRPLALASLLLSVIGIPLLAFLDPINAFYNFFNVLQMNLSGYLILNLSGLSIILFLNVISPNSWCSRLCPLGGLQLLITDIKKQWFKFKKEKKINKNFRSERRQIMLGATSFGLGLAFHLAGQQTRAGVQFRPPGALVENHLKSVCIRCGNCMKACPTDIIKPLTDPGNLMSLLTPRLDFSSSYCLPECTACGDVCPSGAIIKFDVKEKRQLFIGKVIIDLDKCLLTHNRECNQCKVSCAYDAISMKQSRAGFSTVPEVSGLCVGCAACKIVCPVNAIEMVE
jgi:ferredoxin-type protein NapF